ncbi:hypothetical protein D4L85_02170 [Chryseolinea soli]|uniref:Uncharacterized protein n=1 Tax=Chryseolinea soli TaxID=2321403 RepID=A0A385SE27_9BACT|nr:hypothetical protein D4L85_02170 [Chryseolinea soli]
MALLFYNDLFPPVSLGAMMGNPFGVYVLGSFMALRTKPYFIFYLSAIAFVGVPPTKFFGYHPL